MIRLSIRRPVAIAMTYFAIALLGLAAWKNLPLERLPDVSFPRLTIQGSWPGASPETVEAFLTSPIEATVQQITGIERVTSTSSEGSSRVDVEFNRDVDMDFIQLDLSERVTQLEDELPNGVQPLQLRRYVPREFQSESDRPVLEYTFTGPYEMEYLKAHLEDIVLPEILRVEGVGEMSIRGGRRRELRVELNQEKLRSLGLTPNQISTQIRDLDFVQEAGVIRQGSSERTVVVRTRPQSTFDLYNTFVPVAGGTEVRIGELGRIHDTYEEPNSYHRVNGSPSLTFQIYPERGSNLIDVSERARATLEEVGARRPPGSIYILQYDQSENVEAELDELRNRAAVAGIVIFIVLLGFLRSGRSAFVVFATILFSVLIALNLMYWGGLTLNLLTLMGLAMGFGLIVDNSIVVLENVYRRWQGGEEPNVAAERGTKQVVLPVLAATATTLIVFVPFVYLQGDSRAYYLPLGIVVGCTLLASLFVAFTFIPALTAKLLRGAKRRLKGGLLPATMMAERGTKGGKGASAVLQENAPIYERFYAALIGFNLRHPWFTILVAAACLGGSYHLFDKYVSRGVLWGGGGGSGDIDTYIDVSIRLPEGSDLARTDQLGRYFEGKVASIPEVERYTTDVTENSVRLHVTFPDSLEYTAVPPAIKDELTAYSYGFTGLNIRVTGYGPSFSAGTSSVSAPINYRITILGYNYDETRRIAEDLAARLERHTRIQEVDTNASGFSASDDSEYVVVVDRDALSRYGLSVEEFVGRVSAVVDEPAAASTVSVGDEEVRFNLKLEGFKELDVMALQNTLITTSTGGVQLNNVASIEKRRVLARIEREDQQYQRTVGYEFRGPRKLGDLVQENAIATLSLPPGYQIEERDSWRWNRDDQRQIYILVGISLILVFMVTAALFESLLQPLAVLLTVPMALIGVFLVFFYWNATFTREAWIGVIMMGGIVVNNAILLVDHVNQVRREHPELTFKNQILRGTLERVRPILMTTTTTVFGLLPLVLFSEGGQNSRIWNALALTLIGGLASSTLFVLTTTPSLYYLFERVGYERRERRRRRLAGLDPDTVPALE